MSGLRGDEEWRLECDQAFTPECMSSDRILLFPRREVRCAFRGRSGVYIYYLHGLENILYLEYLDTQEPSPELETEPVQASMASNIESE